MDKKDILAFMLIGLAYGILRLAPGVLTGDRGQQASPVQVTPVAAAVQVTPVAAADPAPRTSVYSWFADMKPYCNGVEVETRLRQTPAPSTFEGASYSAACFALAGKIEKARAIILDMPNDDQWRAAAVVFTVVHPVADAGDDEAAGPMMELVVEFWPNHYMALYHAGAARYQTEDYALAQGYLTRFLEHYDPKDGWRKSAISMLETIGESR